MSPSLAEQARTAVALARVGTLTTYSRRAPARARTTVVALRDDDAGLLEEVRPDSPAAADLLERPLATVRIGPPTCTVVLVHGGATRLRGTAGSGRLAIRVEPALARAGEPGLAPVDPRDCLAEADPLRHDAPALLEHLRRRHGAHLAANLRALGRAEASWVEPEALDGHDLVLTVLALDGVERVRLDFPAPVASVAELEPGLGELLRCRGACWCCSPVPRRVDSPGG